MKPYIFRYIRGILSREFTIHTVIYGADIGFWPALSIGLQALDAGRSACMDRLYCVFFLFLSCVE